MLLITIPSAELWDEQKQEFVYTKKQELQLEHSLVSISKWESRWNEVFLSKKKKTPEQAIDYIKCMTITQRVSPEVYGYLTDDNLNEIYEYINAPMTATYFSDEKSGKTSRERVTSELVYYWMTILNIPFECQKWHLNRLVALINVCGAKSQPPRKMSRREITKRNAAINAERRKRWNTKG